MPDAFAEFVAENVSSGVLIIPQSLAFETAVNELTMIWAFSEAVERINRITYLPL